MPNQMASDAITAAPLTGARDAAVVIDARVRRAIAGIAPPPWRPWSDRVPCLADSERKRFVTEPADAMEARRAADRRAWRRDRTDVGGQHSRPGAGRSRRPAGLDGAGVGRRCLPRAFWPYRVRQRLDRARTVNSSEARSAWIAACSAQLQQDPSGLERLPDSLLYLRRPSTKPKLAGRAIRGS
jgi:hypothetical protein